MSVETTEPLVVTHRYDAAPERVFDAFLDPAVARRFLFATADGEMITAEIDARVGGRFTFTDRRPDMGEVAHVGEYLAIDRPRRLVFSFGVPQFDPATTTVTLDLAPAAGGGCALTLTHAGVAPAWRAGTADGWAKILAGLLPAYEGVQAAGWK
jgi:uncharacterized protein YndB with AHSA1/START domain